MIRPTNSILLRRENLVTRPRTLTQISRLKTQILVTLIQYPNLLADLVPIARQAPALRILIE